LRSETEAGAKYVRACEASLKCFTIYIHRNRRICDEVFLMRTEDRRQETAVILTS
jgi:hypothetical protein